MGFQDFSRSKSLNIIPEKKLKDKIDSIEKSTDNDNIKALKLTAYHRYAESNIPVEYWDLKMEKDFVGDPRLLNKYNDIISDLKGHYIAGTSICFSGEYGLGKTLTATSILKKACQKGYSALYCNLSDVVNILTQASSEEKFLARRELSMVDFLMVDEVDVRYFNNSDSANDLFAKTFENIIRIRLQNKLPIFMASNSSNIKNSFNSLFKQSISSLLNKVSIFLVEPGVDHRGIGIK